MGNSLYNYKRGPQIPLIPVVYDTLTQEVVTTPLYVYTIAVKNEKNGDSNDRELCTQVKDFLYRIGCDTTQDITYKKGEIVTMHKRDEAFASCD